MEYIDEYLDYMYEMKTKEEYARDKFNKRYNFKPNIDKNGKVDKNNGDITVDGSTYKLSVSKNGSSSDVSNDESKINLNNKVFKLKNSKRQDFVLNHEIGHNKMHSPKMKNEFRTDESFYNIFDNIVHKMAAEKKDNSWLNDRRVVNHIANQIFAEYGSRTITNEERDKLYKYIQDKYLKNINRAENPHLNASEIEADRYSANKVGNKNANKAINEIRKRSDHKNSKILQQEMDIRSKALKDKTLRDSNLYKNI